MQLTIVKPDSLVILDRRSQSLNLTDFDIPGNLHALQWQDKQGHIEYSNQPNDTISQLPGWAEPVIQEHRRLTELQDTEREQEASKAIHQINGGARSERIRQQKMQQLAARQQKINQLVQEKLQ